VHEDLFWLKNAWRIDVKCSIVMYQNDLLMLECNKNRSYFLPFNEVFVCHMNHNHCL